MAALLALAAWFAGTAAGQAGGKEAGWDTYGGDLANTKYRPFDQINAANFNKLEVAWRFKTDAFGPYPEFKLEGTPIMVKGVL
jgi:quinoprotein glucose dehydrogenase